jgi:hypothetical protein
MQVWSTKGLPRDRNRRRKERHPHTPLVRLVPEAEVHHDTGLLVSSSPRWHFLDRTHEEPSLHDTEEDSTDDETGVRADRRGAHSDWQSAQALRSTDGRNSPIPHDTMIRAIHLEGVKYSVNQTTL